MQRHAYKFVVRKRCAPNEQPFRTPAIICKSRTTLQSCNWKMNCLSTGAFPFGKTSSLTLSYLSLPYLRNQNRPETHRSLSLTRPLELALLVSVLWYWCIPRDNGTSPVVRQSAVCKLQFWRVQTDCVKASKPGLSRKKVHYVCFIYLRVIFQ